MMLNRQSGLGRGLGALIPPKPQTPATTVAQPYEPLAESGIRGSIAESDGSHDPSMDLASEPAGTRIVEVPVQQIDPNPHQPRVHFDHTQLEDLISSIKEHGVIQPLVVTPKPNGRYELIAGERRLRASTIAGLEKVPVIVRDANEQQKLELAIIENVQRQDLNPIEEARAYVRLMEEFGLTQDQVSTKVGKSRPQVGNMVRLLQLPGEIQQALVERKISTSNARTLLSLPTEQERMELFQAMLSGNFTVRQAEERVPHPRRIKLADPNLVAAEEQIRTRLGCQVTIKRDPRGEGEVRLRFTSDEELQALVEKLRS